MLHAIRTYLEPHGGVPASADWAAAAAVAAQHKLSPILNAVAGDAPRTVRAQLAAATRQQRMRNAVMSEAFAAIHQTFAHAGIALIPLKGVAYAHTLYKSPTDRYFDDVDLLIRGGDSAEAVAILTKTLGYAPHPRAQHGDWHHLPPLTHPHHNTTVELHTALLRQAPNALAPARIWQRAQPAVVAGERTQMLHPLDALMFAALHARHHLFGKASFLLDGLLLTQQLYSDDIIDYAKDCGAQLPLAHLYALADQWDLAADLPHIPASNFGLMLAAGVGVSAEFAPQPNILTTGPLPHLLEALLTDTPRAALRHLQTLLNPPQPFVNATYGSKTRRATKLSKSLLAQLKSITR